MGRREPMQGPASGREPVFGREQILESGQFSRVEKDALAALLRGDRTYGPNEARELLRNFMHREVR